MAQTKRPNIGDPDFIWEPGMHCARRDGYRAKVLEIRRELISFPVVAEHTVGGTTFRHTHSLEGNMMPLKQHHADLVRVTYWPKAAAAKPTQRKTQ